MNEALERLQNESPDKAMLVKLRYFTGLTIQQAAEAMNISTSTADRWWTYSRLQIYEWIRECSEKGREKK
jgi:DNA-directed RNA polymerase specialized sigma24 family protein